VGKPSDIVGAVARGIDMFDCVLPTRSGPYRAGLTARGPINIRNARHAEDTRPLEDGCDCPACRQFGRGLPAPPGARQGNSRAVLLIGTTCATISG
jgi:queuine tRNA-ribosyltransferase